MKNQMNNIMAKTSKTLQLASIGFNRVLLSLPKSGRAQLWRYRDTDVYIIKEFAKNIYHDENDEIVNGFCINFMTPDVKNATTGTSYLNTLGNCYHYDIYDENGCWTGTARGKNEALDDNVGAYFRKLCTEKCYIKPEAYTRFSSFKDWGKYGAQFWEIKDIDIHELHRIASQYVKDIKNYRANGDKKADTQIEANKLARKIAECALASKTFIKTYQQNNPTVTDRYNDMSFDFIQEINCNPDKYERGKNPPLTLGWQNISKKVDTTRQSVKEYTAALKSLLVKQYRMLKNINADCNEYLEKMKAYDHPNDMMCKVCLTALMTNNTDLQDIKNELNELGIDNPDTYEILANI